MLCTFHVGVWLDADAIEAGKNVLVDKPLCLNADEAEAMLQAHQAHPDKVRSILSHGAPAAPLTHARHGFYFFNPLLVRGKSCPCCPSACALG